MNTIKVAKEAKTVCWNGMPTVDKPWGSYTDLFRTNYLVFKQIVVNPHSRLSLQRHDERGEFWFVVKGKGYLVYGDVEHRISEGSHIEIPVGMVHCLINDSDKILIVYEMQFGVCSEDDIVRLDDEYGRTNDSSLGTGCPRKICDVLPKGKNDA
tara:strand:- start:268 stop:729 length:462 start_codon:yes stop_codon:yes gene_type:complete